jgi:hypothetical protein
MIGPRLTHRHRNDGEIETYHIPNRLGLDKETRGMINLAVPAALC